ncbi:MAG: hypothetical protein WCR56_00510 [Bacilli bacterium]|jgi:hypothetical protein
MECNSVFTFLVSIGCLFSLFSCGQTTSYTQSKFAYASGTTKDYGNQVYYSDDYFSAPATTYNPSLATTSLCFAMSSFATNNNKTNSDYTYRYKNCETFLKKFGYSAITPNADYLKKPGPDTIGVVYSKKTIGDDTMIAVGIRGSNYEQEWASNFTLGKYADNSYHEGFYKAADELLVGLKQYISDQSIKGNIKIWMAGYSRAGATCNLASGLLDKALLDNNKIIGEDVTYQKEDVYSYCFEDPQGAYFDSALDEVEVKSENYNNIFNIINENDPVPKVAMTAFGFTRYGIDCYLPDSLSDKNYYLDICKVKDMYAKIENYSVLGGEYLISDFEYKSLTLSEDKKIDHVHWPQALFLNEFINALAVKGVKDRDSYVTSYQEGLRDVFILLYKNGLPKGSLVELGMNLAKQLISNDEANILMDDLIHNPTYFVKDLVPLIKRTLDQSGVSIEVKELLTDLNDLLLAIVRVFTYSASLIISLISTTNIKAIGSAHYPELCLSHLMARDSNYTNDPVTSNMDGRYYKFTSDNITSSFTIRKGNRLLAEMKEGVVIEADSTTPYGIDKNQFVAYLPIDSDYTIEMSKDSSATLSIYEPTKLKLVDVKTDFNSSIGDSSLDGNVKVEFK